jgi:hypothetical protein
MPQKSRYIMHLVIYRNRNSPTDSAEEAKKTVKPGLPKAGKRANGGQEGHQGNTLKRVAQPEQVKVHLPEQCQCCGRTFTTDEAYEVTQSRHVFDLPEPKLEVTEQRIGQIECCGLLQHGEYPIEVTASVQ